jgi:hypothetical protein
MDETNKSGMSRKEHLEWAKKRAHLELDRGSTEAAITSMISDLRKHESWQDEHFLTTMFMAAIFDASYPDRIAKWIDGFN